MDLKNKKKIRIWAQLFLLAQQHYQKHDLRLRTTMPYTPEDDLEASTTTANDESVMNPLNSVAPAATDGFGNVGIPSGTTTTTTTTTTVPLETDETTSEELQESGRGGIQPGTPRSRWVQKNKICSKKLILCVWQVSFVPLFFFFNFLSLYLYLMEVTNQNVTVLQLHGINQFMQWVIFIGHSGCFQFFFYWAQLLFICINHVILL